MILDEWQKKVLETEGNVVLRSGRQCGKSTIISIKAGEYAVKNRKKQILVISATERQAFLLFSKILLYLDENHKKEVKTGKHRPTKSEIKLKNGSIIRCLPTGLDGLGIRGYTTDLLIADEAAFIPEAVWSAVTPQIVTTGGSIILLSTPHGREGYFYDSFKSESFTSFHVSTIEVAEQRPEPMRTRMLEHIESERKKMSKLEFTQEYLGEFIDELRQFFPDDLIKSTMTLRRGGHTSLSSSLFLGVDVARMGEDESTFEIIDRTNRDLLIHVESIVTTKQLTTRTADLIVELEKKYKFKKIYIDDGGLGVAVFDYLLREDSTKRKVEAINNAKRSLDRDNNKRKKLFKEDLYNNLLALMEKKKIKLLDDPEIFLSLKSVQYEYNEKGQQKIFGKYTHITEGLIRAAWCVQDKSLNLWVRY